MGFSDYQLNMTLKSEVKVFITPLVAQTPHSFFMFGTIIAYRVQMIKRIIQITHITFESKFKVAYIIKFATQIPTLFFFTEGVHIWGNDCI